jgi:hypothetical protein
MVVRRECTSIGTFKHDTRLPESIRQQWFLLENEGKWKRA